MISPAFVPSLLPRPPPGQDKNFIRTDSADSASALSRFGIAPVVKLADTRHLECRGPCGHPSSSLGRGNVF